MSVVTPLRPDERLASDITDSLFSIARDGARPHVLHGIAKRMRTIQTEIQQAQVPPKHVLIEWAAELARLAHAIEGVQ